MNKLITKFAYFPSKGHNEVSIVDMETGDRKTTLWSSTSPSLTYRQVGSGFVITFTAENYLFIITSLLHPRHQESPHSARGLVMTSGQRGQTDQYLLTGGTDQRLRMWSLTEGHTSSMVSPSATDNPDVQFSYKLATD